MSESNVNGAHQRSNAAKVEHAHFCFATLEARLSNQTLPEPAFDDAEARYPVFVTWNERRSSASTGEYRLRGCIGNFAAAPLGRQLSNYALVAFVLFSSRALSVL